MIYYFSGTGNSLFVARNLSQSLQIPLFDMSNEQSCQLYPTDGVVGFVFPTYAWGMPRMVEAFVESLRVEEKVRFVFLVLTCGDDMGYADKVFQKLLRKIGLPLQAAFSVQMRETYICLPGFDVDSDENERKKQYQAEQQLKHIAHCIKNALPFDEQGLRRGAFPWFKTYIVRPLFNALLINDRHFHVEKGACVHCQKCVQLCPLHNITLFSNQQPQWNGHCTHCLRCYHACPKHAIHYGFFTRHKGQVKINV